MEKITESLVSIKQQNSTAESNAASKTIELNQHFASIKTEHLNPHEDSAGRYCIRQHRFV